MGFLVLTVPRIGCIVRTEKYISLLTQACYSSSSYNDTIFGNMKNGIHTCIYDYTENTYIIIHV